MYYNRQNIYFIPGPHPQTGFKPDRRTVYAVEYELPLERKVKTLQPRVRVLSTVRLSDASDVAPLPPVSGIGRIRDLEAVRGARLEELNRTLWQEVGRRSAVESGTGNGLILVLTSFREAGILIDLETGESKEAPWSVESADIWDAGRERIYIFHDEGFTPIIGFPAALTIWHYDDGSVQRLVLEQPTF